METKKTFTANSDNISDAFQKITDWIQETKVSITSKTGKLYIQLPFIIAFVIAMLVPFALIIGIIFALAFGINITFEREHKKETSIQNNEIEPY
ncbi:DUF4342 domain-containing protein [Sphingobacterium corticibacterium]|uniref:DUF4342 domain-containing protein n=1 Tax=Sphingobacterium corticibacterium TaxID=2484746 RepID=A0A4V2DCU8_9SPHI|nr:DUF4342 domain-containing protein [Sphingobacterium corticibacterium]RZF62738.1 DUF4342 domain-containing protein [Sphingobacterium corticibacterium]